MEEVEEEDGETARAALAVTGVIILCVAVVLVVKRYPLFAVRRAAHRPRAARGGAAHPKRRLVVDARAFFLSRHPACRDSASRDDERRARFSDARDVR